MPTPPFTLDEAKRTLAAVESAIPNHTNKSAVLAAAAIALGTKTKTLESRLNQSGPIRVGFGLSVDWSKLGSAVRQARRGELGTRAVLPGYEIAQTSEQLGADGSLERQWIKQKPAAGEAFEIPSGHSVKGVSALVDADGRELAKWVKTRADAVDPAWLADELRRVFSTFEPAAKPSPAPSGKYSDHLTLYPWADPHFGLYAWGREAECDWDLKTAVSTIRGTFSEVVERTAPTKQAILLVGGDTLHSNSNENRTAKSGNVLQVDGRYPKVLLTACETIVANADCALDKHEALEIVVIPGNHDEESAHAVAFFLHAWYRNEPRVKVDLSPSLFRFREFGKVMLGTTHGHTVKAKDMPAIMAARQAETWGRTKHRYVHTFHVHHASKMLFEGGGCITETHQIVAPQDAWHFGAGFLSGRSMQSITYERDHGEIARVRVALT